MMSLTIAGTAVLALALTSGVALAAGNDTPGQQPYQYNVGSGAAQKGQQPYQYDQGSGAAQKGPGGQYTQGGSKDQQQQKSQ
jgi:hypothetical protein